MSTTIGSNIKGIRSKAGLTQEKVAEKAQIPYATFIKIENDHITNPTIQTLVKLSLALNVSIDELIKNVSFKNKVVKN